MAQAKSLQAITELPNEVVANIIWRLRGEDLLTLYLTVPTLREHVEDQQRWKALCLERWPKYRGSAYRGNWLTMFRARATLPLHFSASVDEVTELRTTAEGESSRSLIEEKVFLSTMKYIFELGKMAAADNTLMASEEYKDSRAAVCWWLEHRPWAAVRFVQQTCTRLGDFDMWGSPFVNWPDTPWRRSAIAYFQRLAGGSPGWANQSVLAAIADEVARLDALIFAVRYEDAEDLTVPCTPPVVEKSHWWFYLGSGDTS